jgi:hypothetical protein
MEGAALEIPEKSKHATSKAVQNSEAVEGVLAGRGSDFITFLPTERRNYKTASKLFR